ncbi:helix-turn-helix domain-containing protein [Terasakiella pusilla]|uniref:helix-turn-helix domain-containing protein n=1 Tax=Terasakiella pusilla TaxID=64973 RepID=UPI003AA89020
MEKTLGTDRHKALVDLLIEQRKAIGMTQQQFADSIDEHQSYVARLESGQRRVDVIEFLRFCSLLKLNPNEALEKLQSIPE